MYKKVYQRNLKDCGAACLLSIIKYYNGDNTFNNIRDLTKCNNKGITALNLIEASNKLGFKARGLKCKYEELDKIVKPSICHIVFENGYNHYVVLYKFTIKYVIIFDPYYGIKKYNKKDFLKLWDNIIIELIPVRKLDVIKEKNYKTYLNIIIKNKQSYILIILLSIFSIIFTLVSNHYFKVLIDGFTTISIVLFFITIILLKEFIEFIRNKILIRLEKNVDKCMTLTMHLKMLSLPSYYFVSRNSGDIITKFEDIKYIKDLLIRFPIFIFIDLSLIIITSVILININLELSIIFFLICFLYFLVLIVFDKRLKKIIQKNQETNSIKNEVLLENINLISSIKNLNLKNYRHDIFKESYNLNININKKYNNLYNNMNYIKNLILYIGINILLYLGIMLVNKNTISLSELILFDALIVYFIEPLKDICDLSPVLKNGINAIKRVSEIYAHKSDESNSDYLDNYDIDFRNLTFSYDNYTNILNNFNLKIKDGDKILITGTSGSGKSTIFKLLNKDYKTNNMIYIGQKEINSIDVSNYITYVSQDEKLFNDTLYNNIVLNNNDEDLNKILQLTGLDKVLKYRNLNLNSIIEENGSNLSIGERERIIVSRALLKNSKILILDESLSGLENTDEFNIIKNILNAYIDKTIIYISHSKECNSLFEKKLTIDN